MKLTSYDQLNVNHMKNVGNKPMLDVELCVICYFILTPLYNIYKNKKYCNLK